MNNLKNDKEFIGDLIKEFPEIKDEVLDEDYSGLITLQIGCLTRFTQKAIDTNDLNLVKKIFLFVEADFDQLSHKVMNSLYISYIGKLKIPPRSEAEKLLPEKFKNAFVELEEHYMSGSKDEKLNKFLKGLESK